MSTLVFLSPRPGAGKTTVMINLGVALQQAGAKVLLINLHSDQLFANWVDLWAHERITPTHLGPDALMVSEPPAQLPADDYDYILLEAPDRILPQLSRTPVLFDMVCCCFHAGRDEWGDGIELQAKMHALADSCLYIPCQTKTGEWEATSARLISLADQVGWENIADPLPHCEAIHDLPLLQSHLWSLPVHYRNRQQAFQSLLHLIRSRLTSP